MLLNTGVDATLIPQSSVHQLGLAIAPDQRYELIGFDGSTSVASVVRLELLFLKRTFRGQFLLIGQEWGILGRDILNLLPLLFDGPRLLWDEQRLSAK